MTLRERLKQCWARRPRLHRSSVVVGLLAAGVFVLLSFPGEEIDYGERRNPPHFQYCVHYAHGWPKCWYYRWVAYNYTAELQTLKPTVYAEIPWLSRDAWRLNSTDGLSFESEGFSAQALAYDILIGVGAIMVICGCWEARRRCRRSIWQFTMRDLVVLMTVVGVAFGYWTFLQRKNDREIQTSYELHRLGCVTNLYNRALLWQREPAWLRRLVGDERIPNWLSDLMLKVEWVDLTAISTEKVEDVMPHLDDLRYLETIMIEDAHERPLPVAQFSRLPSLRELQIREYEPLDDATIEQLKTLKQLDKLSITYASSLSEVARRDLEQALPNCEIVAHYER